MPPSRSRFSPAVLVLARAGLTVIDLARAVALSKQAVSEQLAGRARPHPALVPVVRALGGPDVADQVAEILAGGGPGA